MSCCWSGPPRRCTGDFLAGVEDPEEEDDSREVFTRWRAARSVERGEDFLFPREVEESFKASAVVHFPVREE